MFWLKYVEKVLALGSCSWNQACPITFMTYSGVSESWQLGQMGCCNARTDNWHLHVSSFFFRIALEIGFLFEMDEKSGFFSTTNVFLVFFLHYETKQEAKWQFGTSQGLCSHHVEKVHRSQQQGPFYASWSTSVISLIQTAKLPYVEEKVLREMSVI